MDVCPIVSFHQPHDQFMEVVNIHHEIQDMAHGCAWPGRKDEQRLALSIHSLVRMALLEIQKEKRHMLQESPVLTQS